MNRRVIEISQSRDSAGKESLTVRLIEPDGVYPGADVGETLTCTPLDAEFVALGAKPLQAGSMRQAGTRLRQSLGVQAAVHQALSEAITQAKQPKACVPIYFLLRDKTEPIEPLPWETLWDPQEEFLALDRRWPMARMSGGLPGKTVERTFSVPIRVLAFLSATGISAEPEWKALYGALRAAKIPVALTVYLAEPELEQRIRKRRANKNISVDVRFLQQPFDFADIIPNADHAPNIIHFFCHGSTEVGSELLLATQAEWEHGLSGIVIGPKEFRRIPGANSHLWLVTLNCCEGGAPSAETRSFARALVFEHQLPAVAAMREAVAVETANVFCGAFYQALLREIKPALKSHGAAVTIEWARALADARHAIVREHASSAGTSLLTAAANSKEWTLPVIYTRAEQVQLRGIRRPIQSGEKKKIKEAEALRQFLAGLPEDAPDLVRATIKKQIDALEAQTMGV